MRARLLLASFGGAASLAVGARALSDRVATIPLATSLSSPARPTTVLVHGLDSSKETWSGVLADLATRGYPAIAVDLRGHGESPLGAPDEFGPRALSRDVISAVAAAGVPRPYVLVGHSMGGRIAMRAAADDAVAVRGGAAATFAAVVIEDMCVSTRDGAAPLADDAARAAVDNFSKPGGRRFASWEAARAAILPFYGDEPRVDSWKGKRVRAAPGGGSWWSDINPAAQRLARDTVLASSDGDEAWTTLADGKVPFEVHCWYADEPGTVCRHAGPGGLDDMRRRLPAAKFLLFEGSAHSIHNSARAAFVDALCAVVDDAAQRAVSDDP